MEVKQLYPAIMLFVLTGMILGVGILTFDKFADAAKDPTALTEQLTFVARASTATYDELNSVASIDNVSATCTLFNSAYACANWTEAGAITLNSSFTHGIYNITYNYDADSATTSAVDDVRDATATISSSWMTLIITVVVLAIILSLVIGSFGGWGGRK